MHNSIHSSFGCIILLCAGSSYIWLAIMKITVQLTKKELNHTEVDEEMIKDLIHQLVDETIYSEHIEVKVEIIEDTK
jgi:hypothetical protein